MERGKLTPFTHYPFSFNLSWTSVEAFYDLSHPRAHAPMLPREEVCRSEAQMKVLWAPWRMEYILSEEEQGCFICDLAEAEPSRENLLLFRNEHAMVLMNKYPYNNGHILVAPIAHTSDLTELTELEYSETMELFRFSLKALENHMQPEGFNAGLNLGKTGGAGLEEHVHFHIVPRWHGDTNFMPVIGDLRVIPEAIKETYGYLRPLFENYRNGE